MCVCPVLSVQRQLRRGIPAERGTESGFLRQHCLHQVPGYDLSLRVIGAPLRTYTIVLCKHSDFSDGMQENRASSLSPGTKTQRGGGPSAPSICTTNLLLLFYKNNALATGGLLRSGTHHLSPFSHTKPQLRFISFLRFQRC